jgi:hypothetical protein
MTEHAFPTETAFGYEFGMTLRDYFAAKAMQPLIVSFAVQDINWTAEQAYKIADAMLKARQA